MTGIRRASLTIATAATALIAGACSSNRMPAEPTASTTTTTTTTSSIPAASQTARYRASFVSTWTASTHPQDPPAVPHFTSLVGATHNASVAFWRDGALASEGIRLMAERGATTPLDQEVMAAIAAGMAQHLIIGGFIPLSPGTATAEFDISQSHPLVTLVSMVAPSPDWFAGSQSLPLFENGQWVADRSMDLLPWDAGTDSGMSFSSPDLATIPRAPISRIVGFPFLLNATVPRLGTLTFTRLP